MRGVHIFEKPCYREIRVMRGRAMRGLPVMSFLKKKTFPKQLTNSQIIVITPYQHHLNSFDENEWGRSKLHDGSVSSSFYREVYCIASLN